MDLKLAGKTVMITGGSKGIGASCAWSFAAEGCGLKLVARNGDALQALARQIEAAHRVKVDTPAPLPTWRAPPPSAATWIFW
jgi:short-subunit dehydrogenase